MFVSIADVYKACERYHKRTSEPLFPSTIDCIVQTLNCRTKINHASWDDLTLSVWDENNLEVGYISFDWYYSGDITFWCNNYSYKYEQFKNQN